MEDPAKSGTSGWRDLTYDMQNGSFNLFTVSYAKIRCKMEFHLYPFEAQECLFVLGLLKNSSYEVIIMTISCDKCDKINSHWGL